MNSPELIPFAAGRASQRLQEVAQFETSATLHRLLGYKAAGSRGSKGAAEEEDDEEELEGRYKFCRWGCTRARSWCQKYSC